MRRAPTPPPICDQRCDSSNDMKTHRSLPLLLVLFALSGCSALIYEIVWYQLLQLAIGSTAVSLGVLLATFMGGLCIGSIGLPRLRLAGRHPLRIYAALELGIGLLGLLVLAAIPLIDHICVAAIGHGLPGMLLRALIGAVCMLPPTILMGAWLPAIVRWVERSPRGVAHWGATPLAAIGLYGVMAYLVAQRTREIGVRMALGAATNDVLCLVLKDVVALAGIGIAVGPPAAWALTRMVRSQLYGIQPNDAATVAATVGIACVALLAGYVPARRATPIDPMRALRGE